MKKKLLMVLLALSLGLTVVACSSQEDEKTDDDTAIEETDKDSEVDETVEPEDEEIGETEEEEDHEHGAYEWIGEFELKKGQYLLHFGPSPDETLDIGFVKLGDNVEDLEHHAGHLMVIEDKELVKQESKFEAKADYVYTLEMDPEHGHIDFEITEDGRYALVTEHYPSESQMQVFNSEDIEIMPDKEHEGAAE
ncbi:MAG: hypothetical protein ACTHW2_06060 [Tissierella sp.]|uniref:hypothetical protein n=1 Tax=Tissierella sp. TaxID=41274 RepID=UPI003F9723E7